MFRKLALVTVLSLSLAGCAGLQNFVGNVETAVGIGTASVANPVTKERLNQVENAAILAFIALNSWKQACVSGVIPASCKDQIATAQVYTRQIPPYLAQLRTFVKSNDQVNAVVVFNTVSGLLTTVRAQASANGVKIGS